MSVPKLRFKDENRQDFPDWDKKKVIDFAPLQRGFDLPVITIIEGEFPVVFSNGILKRHHEYKVVAPGVVTGRSGTIGNVTYIEQNYWPHNTSLWVTDFKENLPKFVYYFYIHLDLSKFASGSGVPTLNRNDVHRHIICVPSSLKEQIKIADFLVAVDEKIAQLTQKCELLARYKKGVMQQLFSQELRFKDDSDRDFPDWEEKILNDIATFYDSKRIPLKESERAGKSGKFPYYGASGIIDYIDKYIFDGEYVLLSEDGANITTRSSRLAFLASGKFWLNNHAHIMQAKGSNAFLAELLESISYDPYNTGTVQPKLNIESCKKITFNIPCLHEQIKIANFLTTIDEKITQSQTYLDTVKQYKQGLLQQMFI